MVILKVKSFWMRIFFVTFFSRYCQVWCFMHLHICIWTVVYAYRYKIFTSLQIANENAVIRREHKINTLQIQSRKIYVNRRSIPTLEICIFSISWEIIFHYFKLELCTFFITSTLYNIFFVFLLQILIIHFVNFNSQYLLTSHLNYWQT